jgi:F420H(2)-dependent quinone reductase
LSSVNEEVGGPEVVRQISRLLCGFFTRSAHLTTTMGPMSKQGVSVEMNPERGSLSDRIALLVSRVLQRTIRIFNPATNTVLRGRLHPLASRNLMLLSYTGRATGLLRTTPVSYVRDADDFLVPGGGAWWKNFASGPVKVRVQGRWQDVSAEVVSETAPLSQTLGRMIEANRLVSIFTGIRLGADKLPIPGSLERERMRGFVVVRFHAQQSALPQAHSPLPARRAMPPVKSPRESIDVVFEFKATP